MTKNAILVPAIYDGREQAWIKHQLLESYLEKLLLIIGMAARSQGKVEICYVDCFAGPWGDDSEQMEGTSIAISMRTMAMCKQKLAKLGVDATMRALYIELDKRAFGRLSDYLQKATPAGVDAQCKEGDFLALRQDILKWCGNTAFAFFFIDPKGWKTVGVPNLRTLLARPRSEFLINFMYDFINRTAAMREWQNEIAEFLDQPVEVVQGLEGAAPQIREMALLSTYRAGIKNALPPQRARFGPRTAYVRVMDRDRERAKYHLVYLTTHPVGIIEFMQISQGVELIQKRVRAAKKVEIRQQQSGMNDMFADMNDDLNDDSEQASPEVVDQFWLGYLSTNPTVVDEGAFADILERQGWTPNDLQASLARLIKAGKVSNVNSTSLRPKHPLHYEKKEQLVLTPPGLN
ncbi:three-Cys-motif partner protein TcmP [Polaromonas sp.]|uniref:three-Cys-motif partner protein TcmP n=1 Tax=Polaromonas sp. TaxID=1869339 RepID=UPI0032635AD6